MRSRWAQQAQHVEGLHISMRALEGRERNQGPASVERPQRVGWRFPCARSGRVTDAPCPHALTQCASSMTMRASRPRRCSALQ